MLKILCILFFIPFAFSIFHWATFMNSEGKDERGQIIMGKASQSTLGLFLLGGAILLIFDITLGLTKVSFQEGLLLLLSVVMIVNSALIFRFKKII
ncbi:hypothetical protein Q7A53_10585 [Halobacillus rhizosphaerae]|uniref:hypothetical protein n=1 Tax=Halobacillus rhizosphaerae TaxID=3064889 RepID=UPI00398A5929